MARILSPKKWWKMLRTTYGFGVHSPFAFQFITDVIRLPYAYYAYEHIDSPFERLAYRVAVHLRRGDITRTRDAAAARRSFASGSSVIVSNCTEAEIETLRKSMAQGMTFANGKGTVIMVNRNLPRQDFDLFF